MKQRPSVCYSEFTPGGDRQTYIKPKEHQTTFKMTKLYWTVNLTRVSSVHIRSLHRTLHKEHWSSPLFCSRLAQRSADVSRMFFRQRRGVTSFINLRVAVGTRMLAEHPNVSQNE